MAGCCRSVADCGGGGAVVVFLMLAVLLTLVPARDASVMIVPGLDPACGSLGPGTCQARATLCNVAQGLAQGKSGPVKDVFDCAATQGVPKTQVVAVIGPAFQSGQPETIVDRIFTNNTAAASQLRRCVLSAAGLVTMNGTLNRSAMVTKLLNKASSVHPSVVDTIAAAITDCPEPKDLQVADFLRCVRSSCIQNLPDSVTSLPSLPLLPQADHKCKKGKRCKKH